MQWLCMFVGRMWHYNTCMPYRMIKSQSLVYLSHQLGIISLRLFEDFSIRLLSNTLSQFYDNTFSFPDTVLPSLVFFTHLYVFPRNNFIFGGTHTTSISEHLTWILALALNSFFLNHPKEVGLHEEKVLAHLKSIFLSPSYFLGVGSPRLLDQITLMLFPRLFLKNTLLWKTTEPISMPSGIFERLTGMFFLGFRYIWRFAMQADTCTNALQSLQCVECCKVKRRKGVVCGWRIGVSSSQKETLRHRKCLHFPWPSSSV